MWLSLKLLSKSYYSCVYAVWVLKNNTINFIVSLQSLIKAFVMSQIHDKSDQQKGHLFHCTSVFVTIKAFYKAHVVPGIAYSFTIHYRKQCHTKEQAKRDRGKNFFFFFNVWMLQGELNII